MSAFLFGLVTGVILGGFVVDVNIRCPAPLKDWLASFFPNKPKTEA